MKKLIFILSIIWGLQAHSQLKLEIAIGGHLSIFSGFYEKSYSYSYIRNAFPLYASTESHLYFGKVIDQEKIQPGINYSIGVFKKINKRMSIGLNVGHYNFKTTQLRDQGLTDFYPFKWGNYPNGIQIYEKYTFKNNLLLISPTFQYLPFKKLAIFASPSIFFNNAKYESIFNLITSDSTDSGQGLKARNPDSRKTGFLIKGGILIFPEENINFGLEHLRILSAVNKESHIEKNTYSAWAVKVIFNFKISK